MRTRMAAIGASVALAIGGLAACSSSGQDVVRSGAGGAVAAADPAEALKQAAQKTTEAGTAKVSMTFAVTGVPGPRHDLAHHGRRHRRHQRGSPASPSTCRSSRRPCRRRSRPGVGAILGDGNVQIVTDGGDVYLQLGSLSTLLGAATGQTWLKIPVERRRRRRRRRPAGRRHRDPQAPRPGRRRQGGRHRAGARRRHHPLPGHARPGQRPGRGQRRRAGQGRVGAGQGGHRSVDGHACPVDVWIGTDGLVRRVQIGVPGLETTAPSTAGRPASAARSRWSSTTSASR